MPHPACGFAALIAPSLAALLFVLSSNVSHAEDALESKYLSNLRQVTDGFVRAGEGYFSPDGKTIIYQAVTKDYPFYQIYSQPLAGGTPKLLSTGRGRTTCAYFSPDGKHILYASSHEDPKMSETEEAERKQVAADVAAGRRRRYDWPFDPYTDIYQANLDGTNLHKLTDAPGYDAEGAWTPDGKQIVFCSTRDGDPDLYVMNADGSNVRQLTNAPGYDGGPFTSPDGKWVIFRSDRESKEHLQIYAIGIDGKNEVALTHDLNTVNWAPYWHPTKPYIIWTGADHSDPNARPNYDLWLMKYGIEDGKLKPGPIERVTDHMGADVLPVFTPDGKQLMWTAGRSADRSSQLWIADFKLPE